MAVLRKFLWFSNNRRGCFVLLVALLFVLISLRVLLLFKFKNVPLASVNYTLNYEEPVFRRHLKRVDNSHDDFCLVSYNILKDVALGPGKYLPLPHFENMKGSDISSPRHRQFMKEIKWLESDIINLQEVEKKYYENVLVEEFASFGFSHFFHNHGDETNGLATFYKQTKFKRKKTVSYFHNDVMKQFCNHSDLKVAWESNGQRVITFTLLEDRQTGKQVVVANTHIMFNSWSLPAMQALQIALFLRKLHEFLSSIGEGIPWVLSGDFNMYPHFPAYELVMNGKVSEEGLDKLKSYKYKYPQIVARDKVLGYKENLFLKYCTDKLSHPLTDIKSAYRTMLGSEPPLSHYLINKSFQKKFGFHIMKGTLDYIFYSSNTLKVNAVLEPVNEEVIKPLIACPNKYFPSDHLSIKACFKIRT